MAVVPWLLPKTNFARHGEALKGIEEDTFELRSILDLINTYSL